MRICIKTHEQHKIHNNEKCDFSLKTCVQENRQKKVPPVWKRVTMDVSNGSRTAPPRVKELLSN